MPGLFLGPGPLGPINYLVHDKSQIIRLEGERRLHQPTVHRWQPNLHTFRLEPRAILIVFSALLSPANARKVKSKQETSRQRRFTSCCFALSAKPCRGSIGLADTQGSANNSQQILQRWQGVQARTQVCESVASP